MSTSFRSSRAVGRSCALALGRCVLSPAALPWGDEGYEVVGAIASHLLQPVARQQAFALLAADGDPLTAHNIVSETVWADRFRDSDRNGSQVHFRQTHRWHFVDIERSAPDNDQACFGHPTLPAGTPALGGVAADCAVDRIDQLAAELGNAATATAERLLALKFLLHFVGDVHQALHASDDHGGGGNVKKVTAKDLLPGNLHGYWDTEFVQRLGSIPATVAATLAGRITLTQVQQWSQGTPADWAQESSQIARAASMPRCWRRTLVVRTACRPATLHSRGRSPPASCRVPGRGWRRSRTHNWGSSFAGVGR